MPPSRPRPAKTSLSNFGTEPSKPKKAATKSKTDALKRQMEKKHNKKRQRDLQKGVQSKKPLRPRRPVEDEEEEFSSQEVSSLEGSAISEEWMSEDSVEETKREAEEEEKKETPVEEEEEVEEGEYQVMRGRLQTKVPAGVVRLDSGLCWMDLIEGYGRAARTGQEVHVFYRGYFPSGESFDASGKKPFVFHIGRNEVVPGMEQGMRGMREGGHRRLLIPPALAYGNGSGLPRAEAEKMGGKTLLFDLRLQKVG